MKKDGVGEKPQEQPQEVEDVRPKRVKKKPEAEGSRWAAFILLILMLVVGVFFLIQGEFSGGGHFVIE